jgi:hypothetical protein
MTTPYPPEVLDIWGGGQLLAFSGLDGPTPYRHALVGRTPQLGCGLLVEYPSRAALVFAATPPTRTFLAGDAFDLTHADGRTRGAFLDACHLLIEGPCEASQVSEGITVLQRGDRTLVADTSACDPRHLDADLDAAIAARLAWIEGLPEPTLDDPLRRRTYWKCVSVLKTGVYTPEEGLKHRYITPDRWPHRGMWLWDSAFGALGLRHLDPALARDAIEAVLDAQHDDGMIQISLFHRAERSPYTQPPTLAMAAEHIYACGPDLDWLARIYPKLAAYLRWDMANRDLDGGGLLEWAIEEGRQCRCGESGWDNSPRFDIAQPLDAPDFNTFLARECEAMAGFAALLGRDGDQALWDGHRARVNALMNARLWSEAHGLYLDALAFTGEQQPILSAAGFLPLFSGAPTPEQAARLAAHLHDPATFGTGLPVASIAPRTSEYYSKDMWRGPVWVNINWCIARGFERYGLHEAAAHIDASTRAAIEKWYAHYGAIFEYFDDEDVVAPPDLLRKTKHDPSYWLHQVIHDYGWTAALYVDLVAR